jgi:hypothetical protein
MSSLTLSPSASRHTSADPPPAARLPIREMDSEVQTATLKLLEYCESEGWAGYDPYDALNSRLFEVSPLLNTKLLRLALTQLLKRSPINLRRLALIPKTRNPKALALCLSALLKLEGAGVIHREDLIEQMIDRLIALRFSGSPYSCWGYSFAWQGRRVIVPRGVPNLVCTTFVAGALLDAYEQRQDAPCLAMARSAAEYLLNDLYWDDASGAGFSYPQPGLRTETHNANLLAAALFCRIAHHTGETKFLAPALKVARYSAARQNADGSWYYGEMASQRWIDNFHTGYNLSALRLIRRYATTDEFEENALRGFRFYRANFFREDGAARYYHDRTYPIDIHCVAQSILTLVEFRDLGADNMALASSVYRWAMKHLWDERGFFYYRKLRSCTIRTSYMRWSQAWMLLALSSLLVDSNAAPERSPSEDSVNVRSH